jgi:DNA-binding response OmpR family regulator
MRQLAEMILKKCGYRTITATDGVEGVLLFRERQQEIKAVLLDLVMPRKSGEQAYQEMKAIRPDVNVILTSGFKLDDRVTVALEQGIDAFVQKPYTLAKLAQVMAVVQATRDLAALSVAYKHLEQVPTDTLFGRILVLLRELAKGAQACFEDLIRRGRLTLDEVLEYRYVEYKGDSIQSLSRLFDVSRVPASGFDPPKFGTAYDALVDQAFMRLIDDMMAREPMVNTATLIDLNGYIPIHPSRFCKDWTGNHDVDLFNNRCKKFYHAASLRGARLGLPQAASLGKRVDRADFVKAGCELAFSEEAARELLVQTYSRDTGEVVVLLMVPCYVMGQRFGAATATWKVE